MPENNTSGSSVYNIHAHQSKVKDLPLHFMAALINGMIDKSYGDDETASFAAKHPE